MSTTPTQMSRPGTLAEALRRFKLREDTFGNAVSEFLDSFYTDPSDGSRHRRVCEDPGMTGHPPHDALVGAIAEHLCNRWLLGAAPDWVNHEGRFLHVPMFLGPERMKAFLIAESPAAFRRRFIFTEAGPLRRASMPRDGRWWMYEELRTGLTRDNEADDPGFAA